MGSLNVHLLESHWDHNTQLNWDLQMELQMEYYLAL